MPISPDVKDKKSKKKSKKSKRQPEDELPQLESIVQLIPSSKRVKLDEEDFAEPIEEDDNKLMKEGELIESLINAQSLGGYDETDYVVES